MQHADSARPDTLPLVQVAAAELVWDLRCDVGESCVWDARRGCVWFCDIYAGRIHAMHVSSGERRTCMLPAPVGSMGLCASGALVVALRNSVVLFDPDSAHAVLRPLADVADLPPHLRLNDGKVGPDGAFWVGTCDERADKQADGWLLRIDPRGQVRRWRIDARTANGLAWSADGRTMFNSDSRGPWIDCWDFDAATGTPSNRRRIAAPDALQGRPDGAACDAIGNYWSAGVSAGCLNCFAPDGRLLRTLHLPVCAPTMPCFADDMLYVTSLRRALSAGALARYPASGGLLRLPAPGPGAPVSLFEDRP